MDYLTICQRTNQAVGFQGNITSVNTTGYQQVLTQAVKDAYEDIQKYRTDWQFMKRERSVNVGPGVNSYTTATLWAGSAPDLSIWVYVNYDYRRMEFLPYQEYQLRDFSSFNPSEPQYWSVEPYANSLLISPVDQVYTLDVNYIRTIHELTTNTSVPIVPPRHHQLIVYMAIMKLSTFIGNPTLYDTYSLKTEVELAQLMREYNPGKTVTKRPIC